MMVDRESLRGYYAINHILMIKYKYSLHDIEHMLPWEREQYLVLLEEYVRKKNESQNNG